MYAYFILYTNTNKYESKLIFTCYNLIKNDRNQRDAKRHETKIHTSPQRGDLNQQEKT